MSTVRALALDVLVRDELVHQYAEDRGWTPPASYREAVRRHRRPGGAVPDRRRRRGRPSATVREAEEYANWVYAKAGEEALGDRRGQDPQAALDAGRTILTEYADDADVTLDPRFGTVSSTGQYFPSTGGLSVPVTTLAKARRRPGRPAVRRHVVRRLAARQPDAAVERRRRPPSPVSRSSS